MGFCLLKETGAYDFYFAVNVAHVAEIAQSDSRGAPSCLIKLGIDMGDFIPLCFGAADEVRRLMAQAAKIGLGKVELQILAGQAKTKPAPLLFNKPDRIALVRELKAEEFGAFVEDFTTASQIFFQDGKTQRIAGRPGSFALKVNAGGKVPVL